MANTPTAPFWFMQRQGKMEPAGDNLVRLTAPNLAEAYIGIRADSSGRWQPLFRQSKEGPDQTREEATLARPEDAWQAAFELYRVAMVV